MFFLDGDACRVTRSKVRRNVADSDNLVSVYVVDMFDEGEGEGVIVKFCMFFFSSFS